MTDIKDFFKELSSYWAVRRTEMLKRWDFYYGDRQRFYMSRFSGETDDEYQNRILSAPVENHCAKTCDVLVGYLYGHPNAKSRVTVRVFKKNGEIYTELQEKLKDIWRYNDIDSLRIHLALMASVTGFALIHKEFIDSRTGLPFSRGTSRDDKAKYGTVRYDLWDSCDSMPVAYVSKVGEIYPRILGAVLRIYSKDNYSGSSYLERILSRRYEVEEVIEYFDGQSFRRATIDGGAVIDDSIVTTKNPYGNIKTVFTLFQNYGDPMYLEGESDLAQMISLQNDLNEVNCDDKATIAYHSFPILALTKGGKMPSNFIRKVNSVLELDGEQDVKYVVWDNVLEASSKYKEDIRTNMTTVSGVSQISRGNSTNIGQVRSGAGLKTLFQADINAIGLKVPLFKRAEKELVYSTVEMLAKEAGLELEEYYCEVDFPEDFVGLDELLKAQTEQIELEGATMSRRELILQKHPEIKSDEELDALLSEILKERKAIAAADAGPEPKLAKGQSPEKKSQEQTT